MPPPHIEDLCSTLQNLKSGARCWFWYCPNLPSSASRLLLQPFEAENAMQAIKSGAEEQPVTPRDKIYFGVMSVDTHSRCHFGGASVDKTMLRNLALWTHDNQAEYPHLKRLCHAQANLVDAKGMLNESFQMPSMWLGLNPEYFTGTLPSSIAKLQAMKPGDEAFIWMSAHGPNNRPHLCLSLENADPDASQFAQLVQSIRTSITTVGPVIRGVLILNANGAPFLRTQDSIDDATTIVQSILNVVESPALRKLRVAQIVEGKILKTISFDPDSKKISIDLSRQSKCLNRLSPDQSLVFWFTDSDASGKPLLVLDKDKERLKKSVGPVKGAGKTLNGKLVLDSKGRPEFRCRKTMPSFISTLASWAVQHAKDWPSLKKLRGARMICKDADGNIVDRQKDSDAWKEM